MPKRLRLGLFAGLAVVLMASLTPLANAQTAADQDIPGGHFYTQANGNAGAQYGYRITDEGGIGFWSEFQRLGGVAALGYPSSRRFSLDGFVVQATQKVILQWRPEVGQAYFVNVFDKLHELGKDGVLQQQYQIPAQLDPSFDAGKSPDQVQQARLALLNADAAIAAKYNAIPNAVLYSGLPTSQVTNEGPFTAIRLQRVAIQHWTSANPAAGINAGDVTVVNGGDIAKALGLVPADAATPETASGQPAPGAAPSAPAAPTASPTSGFEYHSKQVTDPPVDCNGDNTKSSIPCVAVAPNAGTQYIKGRVMDQKGNHLQFVTVQATITGISAAPQTVQTAGDGTFTFYIAGPPSTTGSCPPYALQYKIMVLTNTGQQDSDIYTVNYDGNCNNDGEFHFDFVKVR
ncbi:MAG TPA: hypothetical protein VK009_28985 [Chloroflexota bacterium]|nr:hypothetical protein [Chloroflexota bacterium]